MVFFFFHPMRPHYPQLLAEEAVNAPVDTLAMKRRADVAFVEGFFHHLQSPFVYVKNNIDDPAGAGKDALTILGGLKTEWFGAPHSRGWISFIESCVGREVEELFSVKSVRRIRWFKRMHETYRLIYQDVSAHST